MFKFLKKAFLVAALTMGGATAMTGLTATAAEAGWAKCAGELKLCKSTQNWPQVMRFGLPGKGWDYKKVDGNIRCDRGSFGGDPVPGKRKICQVWNYSWKRCAGELKACQLPKHITNGTHVRFGTTPHKEGKFRTKFVDGKSIRCDRPSFNGDPVPYKTKSCWYWNTPDTRR